MSSPGDFVARLDDMNALVVSGQDAQTFLQGQLTADVAAVTFERSSLSAYCDVKGRVLALFRLLRHDDRYELLMPRDTIPAVRARLELYRMHAKVSIDSPDPPRAVFGVVGEGAASRLEQIVSPLPRAPGEVAHRDGALAIRIDRSPRFVLLAGAEPAPRIESALTGIARAGREAWALLDVQGGIPRIESATSGAFLPQMLRLAELGAVSFTKGCFPGQEVVARTEHLGAVKRRLYRARIPAPAPAAGTPIRALQDGRERDGGRVVCAASDGPGAELLAVVPIDAAERAALRIGTIDGPHAEILETPGWTGETGTGAIAGPDRPERDEGVRD